MLLDRMQKFTCLTCRVSLGSAENQRDHYKAEWHIYNLKRKLNQLAPLSENEYKQVLQKHTSEHQPAPTAETSFYCDTCSKIFYNEKAFSQHNTSKKHFQMLITNKKVKKPATTGDNNGGKVQQQQRQQQQHQERDKEEPSVPVVEEIIDGDAEEFNESDWEEVGSDEEELEGIPLNECLFCGELSEDMEMNLSHMSTAHTFFIPDLEYCIDLKGLLNYLGIKIASGFCCLYCSEHGKQFASKKSAQQHMIDKGHTKIKMEQSGETLLEFEDFYDYSASYPDGEPKDTELDPEEFQLDGGDYQLKLPSGTVIGHRSLFVYYKQNLKPQPAEKKSKNNELLNKVMTQYRALGWTGTTSKEAVQRAKDIAIQHRVQQKARMKIGMKHNLSMQPHLRCQLAFK